MTSKEAVEQIITSHFGVSLPKKAWEKKIHIGSSETSFYRLIDGPHGRDDVSNYELLYEGTDGEGFVWALKTVLYDISKEPTVQTEHELGNDGWLSVVCTFYGEDEIKQYFALYDAKDSLTSRSVKSVYRQVRAYFVTNGIDVTVMEGIIQCMYDTIIVFRSIEKRIPKKEYITNYSLDFEEGALMLEWEIQRTGPGVETKLFSSVNENEYSINSILERLYSQTLITAYIEQSRRFQPDKKKSMLENLNFKKGNIILKKVLKVLDDLDHRLSHPR